MMYLLFFIAVVFNLFFNTTIPISFGYESGIRTLSFLPMLIYFMINMIAKKVPLSKEAVCIILLAVIIIFFKWAIEQNYTYKATLLLIIPMVIFMCFENLTREELTLLRRITIFFFIAECGLSIVEWLLKRNLCASPGHFEDVDNIMKWTGFFKSTSLFGHPLGNAQIVAVFMAFIAVSNFMKKHIQFFLFFLGYVSLFCFNSRGAILVTTFFTVPYFVWKIIKTAQPGMKWMINFSILCVLLGMFYLVTETSMGGRLMGENLVDSSSKTRLEVFNFHKHYKYKDDLI